MYWMCWWEVVLGYDKYMLRPTTWGQSWCWAVTRTTSGTCWNKWSRRWPRNLNQWKWTSTRGALPSHCTPNLNSVPFCSLNFVSVWIGINYYHSFSVTFEANSSNASEVGQKAHSENASSGGGERESVMGQPKTVCLFVIFHLYLSCLFGPLKMVQQDRSHSACRNLQSKHHPKTSLLSFATPCMDQSFSQ